MQPVIKNYGSTSKAVMGQVENGRLYVRFSSSS